LRVALALGGLAIIAVYCAVMAWVCHSCLRPFPCDCRTCRERRLPQRTFDEGVDALDQQTPPPSTDS